MIILEGVHPCWRTLVTGNGLWGFKAHASSRFTLSVSCLWIGMEVSATAITSCKPPWSLVLYHTEHGLNPFSLWSSLQLNVCFCKLTFTWCFFTATEQNISCSSFAMSVILWDFPHSLDVMSKETSKYPDSLISPASISIISFSAILTHKMHFWVHKF